MTKTTSPPDIIYYGIRHHGPGCAHALQNALNDAKPEVILLECPSDAEPAFDFLLVDQLKPPVAIMLADPKNPEKVVFYPMARFSPEWIALEYSYTNKIPVIPIDLAAGSKLKTTEEEVKIGLRKRDQLNFEEVLKKAGVSDSEKWWDNNIEEAKNESELFELIAELMTIWRAKHPEADPLNLTREAYMRCQIRAGIKKFPNKRIAVICGAYHIPALEINNKSSQEDKKILSSIQKIKMGFSWIPWSYQRLSRQSGYGAGVQYPKWYEYLFDFGFSEPQRWFSSAAQTLRSKGLDVSPASVLDATTLSLSLTKIRGGELPGLTELREPFMHCFTDHNPEYWKIIEQELLIGSEFGDAGPYQDNHPIKRDLNNQLKKYRLSSLVKRKEEKERKLDLRKSLHLQMSQFLHQLSILNIPFGRESREEMSSTSSFAEHWSLAWQEEYFIGLMEAGLYGNTIREAAVNFQQHKMEENLQLPKLTENILAALLAGLWENIPKLVESTSRIASVSKDLDQLIDASSDLAIAMRYGNVREFETTPLKSLLFSVVPRILIGLPQYCFHIKTDRAKITLDKVTKLKMVTHLLDSEELNDSFTHALLKIESSNSVHPLLKGYSTKLLLNRKVFKVASLPIKLSKIFKSSTPPLDKAHWLEGFLVGGMLTILFNPLTLKTLINFVGQVDDEEFMEILPVLRRSFESESQNNKNRFLKAITSANNHSDHFSNDTSNNDDLNYEKLIRRAMEESSPLIKEVLFN